MGEKLLIPYESGAFECGEEGVGDPEFKGQLSKYIGGREQETKNDSIEMPGYFSRKLI